MARIETADEIATRINNDDGRYTANVWAPGPKAAENTYTVTAPDGRSRDLVTAEGSEKYAMLIKGAKAGHFTFEMTAAGETSPGPVRVYVQDGKRKLGYLSVANNGKVYSNLTGLRGTVSSIVENMIAD